jgi:homogentisate 1,2-dioxygenase
LFTLVTIEEEGNQTMADKEDKANGGGYVIVPRFPATDPQKVFHYTDLQRSKPTRANDPYEYLQGWGNRHQSEVIPGTLPAGQNNPQENRFGLYTEGITYSAFAAPRHANFSTYMYRVRPAAAHSRPPFYPRIPHYRNKQNGENNEVHLATSQLQPWDSTFTD